MLAKATGKKESYYIVGGDINLSTLFEKYVSQNAKIDLLYELAIVFLDIIWKTWKQISKVYLHKHSYVYCNAIHTNKTWKQSKCPVTDD